MAMASSRGQLHAVRSTEEKQQESRNADSHREVREKTHRQI